MKKKAALLLVLALLLNVMMPMSSFAENTVVLSDSLSSDTMTIGKEETITYELSLPAESNINNLQLEIHYDKDVIEATSTSKLFNKFIMKKMQN